MKRLTCIFLIILLVLSTLPLTIFAAGANTPTLTIEQSDICVGKSVEVKIKLNNNPGIISANLKVTFSKNLTLVNAKNGEVFSTLTYVPPKALSSGLPLTSESRFLWHGSDIQDADIKNGTVLTLYFEYTKGSDKPYQISVTSEAGDVIDKNMHSVVLNATKDISVDYHKGSTTIKNKKGATTSADGYTGDSYCASCNTVLSKGKTISKIKTVSLSKKAYRYNGKIKTPSVTVKDSNNKALILDKDYTISYSSDRTKVGNHNIVITFKDNYSGTSTLSFAIYDNLKAPKTVTARLYGYDDVKVSWSKVSKAKAYKVYYKKSTDKSYKYKGITTKTYMNVANLSDGIKYDFKVVPCAYANKKYYADDNFKVASTYTLKKLSAPKVSKVSKSNVKVSWKNINGESGYELSVSTSKNSVGKVYSTTSSSKTLTVIRNKNYYYKVRAYSTLNGKRIYTDWSAVKTYKLK